MRPDEALDRLLEGNERYVAGRPLHPRRDGARRADQVDGQAPFAVVLGCSDSRVPPEVVFDEGIGDLFVVRVAGNTAAGPTVLGSIEYAATHFACPLLLVLGHERCGAVTAAAEVARSGAHLGGALPALVEPILPSVEDALPGSPDDVVAAAVAGNVRRTVEHLRTAEPMLAALVRDGTLAVVGARYRLGSGRVDVVEGASH